MAKDKESDIQKWLSAYHEAGHCLMGDLLHLDVERVRIIEVDGLWTGDVVMPAVEEADSVTRTSVAVAGILAEARYAAYNIYTPSIRVCDALFSSIKQGIEMMVGNDMPVYQIRIPVRTMGIDFLSSPVNFTREDADKVDNEVFDDMASDPLFRNAVRRAAKDLSDAYHWSLVTDLAKKLFATAPKWIDTPF
jgi:ATP-dependent Zn protease